MVRRAVLVAVLVVAVAGVLLWRSRTAGSEHRPPEGLAPEGPWTLVVDVRDPMGAPVAAGVWIASPQGDLLDMAESRAGEELRFGVEGKVVVMVAAEGLANASVDGVLAPAGTEKRVSIALERGMSITGQILDPEDDVRLRGMDLMVTAVPLDAPWNVQGDGWDVAPVDWGSDDDEIDRDGNFEIRGLVKGRYRLYASTSWEDYCARETPIVAAGTTGVRIQLVRRATLGLRFVDTVTQETPTDLDWELTDEDDEGVSWQGSASWKVRVRPGMRGKLGVHAEGYLPHESIPIVAGAPGEVTEIVCELVPDPGVWAELDLILRDEEGLPVVNAEVSREWHRAVSREEGRYRLRVPAGVWWIRAEPERDMVRRLLAFWLPHGEEIRLERGEHVQSEWTVKQGGLILVRGEVEQAPWVVVDGKRTVLPERWNSLLKERQPAEWIELVPPGTYRVEARCGGRVTGTEVVVPAGEVTTVTFPFER